MQQCAFDLDGLRERVGDDWQPFADYDLELARAPNAKAAGRLMRAVGTTVPTGWRSPGLPVSATHGR